MAKRSNNSLGRRAYGGKPYDANNSFVKKMATKVTDFIPQRSWISKWFNSSEDNGETNDNENPEENDTEEEVQPPASKRPRIRMDVMHPPGTFSIRGRSTEATNDNHSGKDPFSNVNETGEDFLEPPVAGPSGVRKFVASTPAINPQRLELNSLIPSRNNNRTSNGADDNSESSESTSGCSSLIPQTNRQEAPTNSTYNNNSTLASRKRMIDEKMSFTNHLQSPRCLFLESGSGKDTLSSRRPSFNASMMSNTLDRTTSLSSPFYTGNVTFGGANALSHYKPSRSLFNSTNEFQLKVPRRTSVQVKPSSSESVDSSGMSQTAKRILEAMEYFSSPISDAKKIPMKNTASPASGRKRLREDEAQGATARVGLRHLTRELSVPTVPEMLKLRRRQKLQDTTLAARKIVSAMSGPPSSSSSATPAHAQSQDSPHNAPPIEEYQLRPVAANENPKFHGKLRGKSKKNIEDEEPAPSVNLPRISLPITSLPSFAPLPTKYTKPPNVANHETTSTTNSAKETFKFASPIKISEAAWNLKSINNFSFSKPLNAEEARDPDENHSSKTVSIDSNSSFFAPPEANSSNFMWSNSSTAPRLKLKTKPKETTTESFNSIPKEPFELKSGSVMDILAPKTSTTTTTGSSDSTATTSPSKTPTLRGFTLKNSGEIWECVDCYIKNDASEKICVACKAAKPNVAKSAISSSAASLATNAPPSQSRNDSFGAQFKMNSNQWECQSCLVRNQQNEVKCVSCATPKPADKSAITAESLLSVSATKSTLMDKFKAPEGSWECPGCMLRNPGAVITCPCCKAAKPSSLKISPNKASEKPPSKAAEKNSDSNSSLMDKFKPATSSWECSSCMVRNNDSVNSCVCCSNPKPGSSAKSPDNAKKTETPISASNWGDKFKKPEGSWSCDSCMVQNKSEVTECVACGGLKPGATAAKPAASGFSFGIPANSQKFSFGIDKANEKPAETSQSSSNGFSFGAKASSSSENDSAASKFTFGIPKDSATTSGKSTENPPKPMGFVFAAPKTTGDEAGFKFEATKKTEDAQTAKNEEKKAEATFSFGLPKTVETPKGSENKSIFGAPSAAATTAANGKPHFVFGVPKSDGPEPEASKSAPKMTFGIQSSDKPAEKSSIFGSEISQTSSVKESEKSSIFSSKSNVTESSEQAAASTINPSLSSSTASSNLSSQNRVPFTFSEPKSKTTSEPSNVPSFGQNSLSTSAGASSNFANPSKPTEISASASGSPFGVAAPSSTPAPSLSATPAEKSAPAPSVFSTFPTFNNSPSPAFGASSSSTPASQSLFGTNNPTPAPVFGSGSVPSFGTTGNSGETPSIFAKAPVATAAPSNPGIFTFGASSTSQQAPAAPTPAPSFSFTGNATPANSAAKSVFAFGGASAVPPAQTNAPNECFGNATAATAPPAFGAPTPQLPTPSFSFNAPPKQDPPSFGQATGAIPSMFGTQTGIAAPSIGQTQAPQPASTGFSFGAAAPAPTAGVFSFGGGMQSQPASAPSGGFNFNAPSPSPAIAFDPNTRPTFNFTGGSAPTAFNATPQQPATTRKIKKAVRRMPQR